MVYVLLFGICFLNEALLTSYYIHAAKGRRWLCVGISIIQQFVSVAGAFYNLIDVEPLSREQFVRWTVTAVAYGTATYVVVKPNPDTGLSPSEEDAIIFHDNSSKS